VAPFLRGLSPADKSQSSTSIAGALNVAATLPHRASLLLQAGSKQAFVDGLHLASLSGAVLALCAAVIVYLYLPHSLVAEGAMHGPVESLEDAAELGLAGAMPVFADSQAPTD
jgi:hypothetical protein